MCFLHFCSQLSGQFSNSGNHLKFKTDLFLFCHYFSAINPDVIQKLFSTFQNVLILFFLDVLVVTLFVVPFVYQFWLEIMPLPLFLLLQERLKWPLLEILEH